MVEKIIETVTAISNKKKMYKKAQLPNRGAESSPIFPTPDCCPRIRTRIPDIPIDVGSCRKSNLERAF